MKPAGGENGWAAQVRMNRRLWVFLLVLALAGVSPGMASQSGTASGRVAAESSSYDAASFAAELHRIAQILNRKPDSKEVAALRDSLPSHWEVNTPEGDYSISSEPLKGYLSSGSLDKADAWVIHLAEEVESSSKHVSTSPQAHEELDRILARPEYGAVHPPGWWELMRERITAWLERLLERVFSGIARHPIGGQILFWLLVVAGVGVIAAWVFRFFANRDRRPSLPKSVAVVVTRTWQEWIRAAREASNTGNYREAVHCAYWAGIVRLEDAGVLPKDRTKTPREYLRLVTEPAPGQLAASPAHREPLTVLTRGLERVWYANRGAGPGDYSESLRQLEALGCSLE